MCYLGVRLYRGRVKCCRAEDTRMRILLLALPVALLTFGSIELSSQSEQTKPAVSRVHQLQIEDQSENPGNISPEDYYRHGDARREKIRKLLKSRRFT